jgi:large subunit ribosomal protein L17
MRHRKSVKKLGRTAAHRNATLSNLSATLFERKHIKTTEAKAKAARQYSERLITLAKKETLHARRLVLRRLKHKRIVKILFDEIVSQYADRNGGYTRIVKLGRRAGDGASMAVLELVGYEMASKKKKEKEVKEAAKEKAKGKTKVKEKKSSKEEDVKKGLADQGKAKEEKKTKKAKSKGETRKVDKDEKGKKEKKSGKKKDKKK